MLEKLREIVLPTLQSLEEDNERLQLELSEALEVSSGLRALNQGTLAVLQSSKQFIVHGAIAERVMKAELAAQKALTEEVASKKIETKAKAIRKTARDLHVDAKYVAGKVKQDLVTLNGTELAFSEKFMAAMTPQTGQLGERSGSAHATTGEKFHLIMFECTEAMPGDKTVRTYFSFNSYLIIVLKPHIQNLAGLISGMFFVSMQRFGYFHIDSQNSAAISFNSLTYELNALNMTKGGTEEGLVKLMRGAHDATLKDAEDFVDDAQSDLDEGVSCITSDSKLFFNPKSSDVDAYLDGIEPGEKDRRTTAYLIYSGIAASMKSKSTIKSFLFKGEKAAFEVLTETQLSGHANRMAKKVRGFVIVYLLGCKTEDTALEMVPHCGTRVVLIGSKGKYSDDRQTFIYQVFLPLH